MRIERIALHLIAIPLREPFVAAHGTRSERHVILVTVHSSGVTGWGECVALEDPSYSAETTETAWHVLRDWIAPAVVGCEVDGVDDVLALLAHVRGNPMARAALEMAMWDLVAKRADRPLAEELGSTPRPVDAGVSLGMQPDEAALLARVEAAVREGYRRVKLKIAPGRDLGPLAAVRRAFPELPLTADANSAYSLADLDHLRRFDDLGLTMIEQPLGHDDLHEHARLAERISTPVCLDESIVSPGSAALALELGACSIVNLKPGRVGGLANAVAIHDLCVARGIPVWCGGMLEAGIGRAHNVALASLPGFTLPGDLSPSRRYWHEDVIEPEFTMHDGRLIPVAGAGIGVTPREDRITALTVRRDVIDR